MCVSFQHLKTENEENVRKEIERKYLRSETEQTKRREISRTTQVLNYMHASVLMQAERITTNKGVLQ